MNLLANSHLQIKVASEMAMKAVDISRMTNLNPIENCCSEVGVPFTNESWA
jgi:hypothetical protein